MGLPSVGGTQGELCAALQLSLGRVLLSVCVPIQPGSGMFTSGTKGTCGACTARQGYRRAWWQSPEPKKWAQGHGLDRTELGSNRPEGEGSEGAREEGRASPRQWRHPWPSSGTLGGVGLCHKGQAATQSLPPPSVLPPNGAHPYCCGLCAWHWGCGKGGLAQQGDRLRSWCLCRPRDGTLGRRCGPPTRSNDWLPRLIAVTGKHVLVAASPLPRAPRRQAVDQAPQPGAPGQDIHQSHQDGASTQCRAPRRGLLSSQDSPSRRLGGGHSRSERRNI